MKFTVAPRSETDLTNRLLDDLERRQAVSREKEIAEAIDHAFDHDDQGCERCDQQSEFLAALRETE